MEFHMNNQEATSAMQQEVIKKLRKDIAEQKDIVAEKVLIILELKKQIETLENANRIIKNKLYDAEAVIVCNRLVFPEGVKAERGQEQKKTSKCIKAFFVPAKVK